MIQVICQDHPEKQLTSICIANHQCNIKVCPVCIHQNHLNIGNQFILPSEYYQAQILKALQLKELYINNICKEEKNWVTLTKNIEQQFQNLIQQINNYWKSVYQTFQTKVKILEQTRKELEVRSVLEFSKNEIQNLSQFITISEQQIQEQIDQQVQHQISKQNREQIENKFINLCNEIRQSLNNFRQKRNDDELIESLKDICIVNQGQTIQNPNVRQLIGLRKLQQNNLFPLQIDQQPQQQNQRQSRQPSVNSQLIRNGSRSSFRIQQYHPRQPQSVSPNVQDNQNFNQQQQQNIIEQQKPVQQVIRKIKIEEITQEQAQIIIQQNTN